MRIGSIGLTAALLCLPAWAQEKNVNTAHYKLEYRIRETLNPGGKTDRRYTQMVDSTGKGTFRVGSRVPYTTSTQPGSTQYNYADIGVNIDSTLREAGDKIGLGADLEISSVASAEKTTAPTIGSLRIRLNALLEPGKSMTVASVDDPVTQRKFEVDAVATRVN